MCWLHVSGSATPSPKLPQLEDDCFRPPSRLSVMFVEWQNPRDKRRRWPWNALMAWSYWLYMDLPLVYIREMAFQIDRWPRCVLKWWLVWEPEGPKMLNASQRKKEPSSEGASNLSNAVLVYWPKLFKLWNPLNYTIRSFKANWKQPWIWRFNICVWSNPLILGTWTLEASWRIVLSRLCGIGRACLCSLSGALRLWVCHSNWQKQFLHI